MNILVVDDDAHIRELLIEVLQDIGYDVGSAVNGYDALSVLRACSSSSRPCLILLDLMMPRMNGWEFIAAQQVDPAIAGIPIVVLSAHLDIEYHSTTLGVVGHLRKPVELDDLIAAVQRLCPLVVHEREM
jgi:CheY-like chemotaxis protein